MLATEWYKGGNPTLFPSGPLDVTTIIKLYYTYIELCGIHDLILDVMEMKREKVKERERHTRSAIYLLAL